MMIRRVVQDTEWSINLTTDRRTLQISWRILITRLKYPTWKAGRTNFTWPKCPLQTFSEQPQVSQFFVLLEIPIRPSSGPFGTTARSLPRSNSFRSETSTTAWLIISLVDLNTQPSISAEHHATLCELQRAAYRTPNLSSLMTFGTWSMTWDLPRSTGTASRGCIISIVTDNSW